jgi:hypothetical protein
MSLPLPRIAASATVIKPTNVANSSKAQAVAQKRRKGPRCAAAVLEAR